MKKIRTLLAVISAAFMATAFYASAKVTYSTTSFTSQIAKDINEGSWQLLARYFNTEIEYKDFKKLYQNLLLGYWLYEPFFLPNMSPF